MNARQAGWLKLIAVLGIFLLGCGRTAAPKHASTGVRPPHRLQFHADPQLSCGKRDDVYDRLSGAAQAAIGANGNHLLRVAIEHRPKNTIRLAVALVDEEGSTVDEIDQAVGGHMDCPRLVRIAAGLASTMVEKRGVAKKDADPLPEPDAPRKSPVKVLPKPEPAELDGDRLRRPALTRRSVKEDGYAPVPHASTVVRETPAPSPSAPPMQIPIEFKVRATPDVAPQKEEEEKPSLLTGKYLFGGVGVLRGQDPNLNAGARFGVGYALTSFALEADLLAVGAVVDTASLAAFNTQSYAVILSVSLCGRSTSLGLCLMGSAMHDGFSPTDAASPLVDSTKDSPRELISGAGLGAGMRAWYEILSGKAWALRLNLEMTIPIKTFGGDADDLRVWKNITPTGAAVMTFAHTF